jgi:phosphoribosylformylglycinamidine synthase
MTARVYVSLKPTVLDPQGQTVLSALQHLGFSGIQDVRQGKFFEIRLGGGDTREGWEVKLEQAAQELLANPVIEDYRVEILD